jgi:hypothetical protein
MLPMQSLLANNKRNKPVLHGTTAPACRRPDFYIMLTEGFLSQRCNRIQPIACYPSGSLEQYRSPTANPLNQNGTSAELKTPADCCHQTQVLKAGVTRHAVPYTQGQPWHTTLIRVLLLQHSMGI